MVLNPATNYVVFRTSSMRMIKAWRVAKGDFLGSSLAALTATSHRVDL
jgi:hypothetical protein